MIELPFLWRSKSGSSNRHRQHYKPSRRKVPRVRSSNLLKCIRSDDFSGDLIVNLKNLSEAGLRFVSPVPIKPGSILKMLLHLTEETHPIPVVGKVVWATKSKWHWKCYQTGISFISIASEDRQMIRKFVETRLQIL